METTSTTRPATRQGRKTRSGAAPKDKQQGGAVITDVSDVVVGIIARKIELNDASSVASAARLDFCCGGGGSQGLDRRRL